MQGEKLARVEQDRDGKFGLKVGDEFLPGSRWYSDSVGIGWLLDDAGHINAASDARLEAFRAKIVEALEGLRAGEFQHIPDGRWAIDAAVAAVRGVPL